MAHSLFAQAAALLALAVAAVYVLKMLRLPTIPAYFIVGILAGPGGLGILHSTETAHDIAELGIVLLLFTVGLKFDLNGLYSMKRFVFVFGGLQVAAVAAPVGAVAYYFLGDLLVATLLGFIVAMSSTAIVSQILIEKSAVNLPIGRRAMGAVLFQDIIVIPLLIIYSSRGEFDSVWISVGIVLLKTALTLVVVMVAGPPIMRRSLDWVVRHGDKESFAVSVFALIVMASLLTGIFGLSPVLGAFLAGVLIAETYHRYRVEQIIEPFRQLLLGFFFMSLGILIDPAYVLENIWLIIGLSLVFLLIKTPLIFILMRALKTRTVAAYHVAFLLGGAGEFGFALFAVARDSGILSEELFQLLLPVNLLGIAITSILVNNLQPMLDRALLSRHHHHDDHSAHEGESAMTDHIIVCGFGRTGQTIYGVLSELPVKFLVLEEDSILLQTTEADDRVMYGHADNMETAQQAGIANASAIIITYTDEVAVNLTISTARRLNPDICIVAKALSLTQARKFAERGATKVFLEAQESGISMAKEGLALTDHISEDKVNEAVALLNLYNARAVHGEPDSDDVQPNRS